MVLFAKKSCARRGSRRDVKVVTYVRRDGDQKVTEPWCQECRRQKLVKHC